MIHIMEPFRHFSALSSNVIFFFSSRRRHTRSDRDWSSDVCSSDLSASSMICNRDHLPMDQSVSLPRPQSADDCPLTDGGGCNPEVVRLLRDPAIYGEGPAEIVVRETHISCVFLTGRHAYKLKKPVRFE